MEKFVYTITCGCLVALVAVIVLAAVAGAIHELVRLAGNKRVVGVLIVGLALICCKAYPTAAEKQTRIEFLQTDPEIKFLIDKGSWVKGETVHLEFETRLLPQSAMVYLDYADIGSDNYTTYISGSVAELEGVMEFKFTDAAQKRWVFYTTWTPGPNVHTNGVAVAECIKPKEAMQATAVPKRTVIYLGNDSIWPKKKLLDKLRHLKTTKEQKNENVNID